MAVVVEVFETRFPAAPGGAGGAGAHRTSLCVEIGEKVMMRHQNKTHHHHADVHLCGFIFAPEMFQHPAGAVVEKKKLTGGS